MEDCRSHLEQALVSLAVEARGLVLLPEARFASKFSRQRLVHFVWQLMSEMRLTRLVQSKVGDQNRHEEAANAYELLSRVCMLEHKRLQAGYCAMRALNMGLALPSLRPVVARAYASLCLVESASQRSNSSLVQRYKRNALHTCDLLGELGQLTFTLQAAGVHYAGNARWWEAVDSLSRAADIAKQLQDKRQWEECISHQGHLEYYRGDFSQSKQLYEDAISSAKERGDKQMMNR